MSSPPTPPASYGYKARGSTGGRLRGFWRRISEGRQIDDLWTHFVADARASYGFYGHDVDWERIHRLPRWRRPFHVAKEFFWALLLKMTPARRVLLVIGLVLIMFSATTLRIGSHTFLDIKMEGFATIIFLLLLALELADKVTMKRDLEIAREIQTWLVPAQPPQVDGGDIAFATRPQNSVAGDYYDAFYPDPQLQRLLLVIADVAGKSVPAALLMATLQASLRTIAGEGASLAELVMRLNRYACAHSLDGRRFTTAVVAEYDPATRQIAYVNAGHNLPILRRANGTTAVLDAGGLPFGIESTATYDVGAAKLEPGDTLIFFTDGVVEAFDESGQEFGNARWLEAIRALPATGAAAALQHLMSRVDVFVGATRQSDDITCMVFRST
ncbi:MAG TPA: PP2C family protein-serine/threonine phosphatase [Candidatus Dormibacteraeota bacterium]|nr:PP2C family protein-serine/threonine phosphatase [Candidatus Dormibacteraeota bacterium]